jgi:hypothetical protein
VALARAVQRSPVPSLLGLFAEEVRRVGKKTAGALALDAGVTRRAIFAWRRHDPTKREAQEGLLSLARRIAPTSPDKAAAARSTSGVENPLVVPPVARLAWKLRAYCRDYLSRYGIGPCPEQVRLRLASVAGVRLQDLLGPGRRSRLVAARRALSLVLREEGCTVEEIAGEIGRDHSTVSYYLALGEHR